MRYYFKSFVELYISQNLLQFVIPFFYRFQYFTTKVLSLHLCIKFHILIYILKTSTITYRKHIPNIFINFDTVLSTFTIPKSYLKLISISERESKKLRRKYNCFN